MTIGQLCENPLKVIDLSIGVFKYANSVNQNENVQKQQLQLTRSQKKSAAETFNQNREDGLAELGLGKAAWVPAIPIFPIIY